MKIVISPAKSLDYKKPVPIDEYSYPAFLNKSQELINELKRLHPEDIARLMSVSKTLAELNFERFQQWHLPFDLSNARQALFAFDGDVYDGINARSLNASQLATLNGKLRILSGLYGILKPYDLMQPYRLEMGSHFGIDGAKNLYQFWNDDITGYLNEEFAEERIPILVNLASEEYFKSIKLDKLNAQVVTPTFLETKGGKPRIVAFSAKRARGMMVRFMAEHSIDDVEDLKTFDYGGYSFSEEHTKNSRWAFIR